MNQYLFFLGRNSQLSLLELESVFDMNFKGVCKGVVLCESNEELEKKQDLLGGTIKIAKVFSKEEEIDIDDIIISFLIEKNKENKKIIIALNIFGKEKGKESQFLRNHLLKIKKAVNFPLRFCNNNFTNVSSVVTRKEIVNKGNIEINIINTRNDRYILAETLSCQNINAYSLRDYSKPFRDAKIGMLPPKLAQIMINFAGKTKTIWDPFCGMGTLPMEALLMNKKVIASDISEEMTEATIKNIAWLKNKFKLDLNLDDALEIFKHDATEFIDKKVDAVITEGYLGEPKRQPPLKKEVAKTDELLSELYAPFFQNMKKNGIKTVIICLPVYKMEDGLGFMEKTLESILQSGYNLQALSEKRRKSVIYSREDQFVFREIFKFEL